MIRPMIFIFVFGFLGCASKQHLITPENLRQSQIEITYMLGHSLYKYVATGGKTKAEVSSYRDNQVLEKRTIPLARYQEFSAKLEDAIRSAPHQEVDPSCRTPYKIHIIIEDKERTTSGCRNTDSEGQIGQILKEGEFLFYSGEGSG